MRKRPGRIKAHKHSCPICGKEVTQTGKEKSDRDLVSCGEKSCTSALFSRNAKKRLNGENRPQEWEDKRSKAHESSPLTGRHKDNSSAKEWSLIDPNGEVRKFRNLQDFIRENPELFNDDDIVGAASRAASGIAKLRPEKKERRNAWKGWRWNDE